MIKFTLFVLLGHLANLAYSQQFTCTSPGSFADRTSPFCREYFACIEKRYGIYHQISVKCPDAYKFDWNLNTCVRDQFFACPNNPSDIVVAPQPVRPIMPQLPSVPRPPIISQPPSVPLPPVLPEFVCPGAGNFPNPASTDCRSYFRCTGVRGRKVLTGCRKNRVFDWQKRQCVDETGLNGCPAVAPAFSCSGVGDFLDPTSSDCSTYYRCFYNYDGRMRRQLNICPSNEAFDHFRKQCISRRVAVCSALSPYE
jgi:Chitin binding Peritrophin-A domain